MIIHANAFGTRMEIAIEPDHTVQHLRAAIDAIGGNLPSHGLIFRGKPLTLDDATLGELGVDDGDTVHVVLRHGG